MHQVFWNLITNGVEAMPEGGALEIMASEDPAGEDRTVSIKDSGVGIAPEEQASCFSRCLPPRRAGSDWVWWW